MNVCFNGCSFTVGEGFPEHLRDVYIYDRLISKQLNFNRTNIAEPGSSNYCIFLRSAQAIMSKQYDLVFTQWSALGRMWLSPGPDCVFFTNDQKFPDFKYRDFYLTAKQKNEFNNIILLLNHDYQNIIELIDYCKILDHLSKLNLVQTIYINGLLPWQDDLITPLTDNLSNSLSVYSKHLLEFDNRNDHEIINFFVKLQHKFLEIDQLKWVNLFDSFQQNIIDIGIEGHHPGIKSHQRMAERIINYIESKKHRRITQNKRKSLSIL